MNKRDQKKFEKILLDEQKKIIRHLEDISGSAGEGMRDTGGDPVDIAAMEITQANLQKIGKRETVLLKKIEYSLKKIAEGTYGECEECGEEIGVPRLTARPVAQLCIDCKTLQENKEKHYRGNDPEDEDDSFDGDDS